ncbi:NADPH-dependent F420 reductase [Neokomagataea thailandica]|uniref:Coenzyme F420-dependent NADP oxidoreductase n=1 Tax=Neokomagataea tanensis NBRC 106556 TaxID=1223519 RepID=A0ABQ0QJX3_9PROT|nr:MULTISPECIES: NAD(P)-binding domain-containing protein [Neokomagataea]GBR47334.1 coenzyme F420-dependent NADP oxidoreductase [Neokomagataea tanensis NBRC 106556]
MAQPSRGGYLWNDIDIARRSDLKIGIIGAGNIGQALARLAVANGHTATLSNSRGPETLRDVIAEIGCQAKATADIPSVSDIVVLTVPLTAAFKIAPHLLDGRLVIDTNNYYPDRDGKITMLDQRETTTSQMIANHFSGATIVKAFNAILAKDLLDPVILPNAAKRALPIASDDTAAKAVLTALQADFGYDTVDAGHLVDSWRFERAKPAYCIPLDTSGLISALAAAERDKELPEGSWRR